MGGKCKEDPDYHRKYYQRNRARLIAQERARYQRLRLLPEFRAAQKQARELAHFGTSRETIFARSQGRCVDCGKPAIVVHHLDGDGRTNERLGLPPGKDPDRLVGLCRSCHMKKHQAELHAAYRAARARRWALQFDACVGCGTTEIRHGGKGHCRRCYPKVLASQRKGQACSL